jgi:ankyrin repeat protein
MRCDSTQVPQAPLHVAVCHDRLEIASILLAAGADINQRDGQMKTPLILAASFGQLKMAEFLIRQGALLELRGQDLYTPLMAAVYRGHSDIAKLLIKRGANIGVKDGQGFNLLQLAVVANKGAGNMEMFAHLLDMGLDPTELCCHGTCAVHECLTAFNAFPMVFHRHLLELCPPIPTEEFSVPGARLSTLLEALRPMRRCLQAERIREILEINAPNKTSLLCKAAAAGYTLGMTDLLEVGPDIEHEGCEHGTALMAACAAGQLQAVILLVRRGARLVYTSGNKTTSALLLALPFPDIVDWLLVGRFVVQESLEFASAEDVAEREIRPWSGLGLGMLSLQGRRRRVGFESSIQYAKRLCSMRQLRGRIVRPFVPASDKRSDTSDDGSLRDWAFLPDDDI